MYRITSVISLGRFLTPDRIPEALEHGITDVLNVSDYSNLVSESPDGLQEVVWKPLVDNRRIPEAELAVILSEMHRLTNKPGSHVYIHCLVGQNRAPNVLWLYLIALGIDPRSAQNWIERRSPHAIPGHYHLVDADLILFAQQYGAQNLLPVTRPEILLPSE